MLQFPCFRFFPEGEPPGGTFRFGALGFGLKRKIENVKLKEENEEKEKQLKALRDEIEKLKPSENPSPQKNSKKGKLPKIPTKNYSGKAKGNSRSPKA